MTVLPLRLFGDPVLRTTAEPFDLDAASDQDRAALRSLVDNMLDTMDHFGGVGLAANQVGLTRRIFVYDCEGDRGHILNPTWEAVGEETVRDTEGCLSIPDIQGTVERASSVRLRGVTVEGEQVDRVVDGLLARCVQHETDHLNGIMFLQHLDKPERAEAMKAIRTSSWFGQDVVNP